MKRKGYERDDERWPDDAYRIAGDKGVAWRVLGWETQPDEDTEWTGIEERTGYVLCVMVGDDARWRFEPEDIEALDEDAYCHECGQIGCTHDGRERD